MDRATPTHREASRWEKWLEPEEEAPERREVELFPTTTELERPEYEGAEGAISLRWTEILEELDELEQIEGE